MKIIFLCGGLEPGRDGVGDYIRRLADELIHQGHDVGVLAFNDHFVNKEFFDVHNPHEKKVTIFRIPSGWNNSKRLKQARKWLELFNPDIISLQFVSYAFNKKGLPFTLIRQLKFLIKGYRCHIMFHELWIGMDINSSRKERVIGYVQKLLIQMLVKTLKPVAVHTQTALYQAQLLKLGIEVRYLPIFGNIPISKKSSQAIRKNEDEKKTIYLVIFGGIHPGADVSQFAEEVAVYSKEKSVQIILRLIGRTGKEQAHWISAWSSAGLTIQLLGEQTPDRISEVLLKSSIGITTTPMALVEKSGSVAAMLEHGLPVLCVRSSWKARGFEITDASSKIIEYRKGNFGECLTNKNFIGGSPLSVVSSQFIDSLQ